MPRRDRARTTRLSGLIDRVTQQRRAAAAADPGSARAEPGHEQRIRALEDRVTYLETLLEGLQDSVHREAVRQDQELEELGRRVRPAEIARALGKHSREHGV